MHCRTRISQTSQQTIQSNFMRDRPCRLTQTLLPKRRARRYAMFRNAKLVRRRQLPDLRRRLRGETLRILSTSALPQRGDRASGSVVGPAVGFIHRRSANCAESSRHQAIRVCIQLAPQSARGVNAVRLEYSKFRRRSGYCLAVCGGSDGSRALWRATRIYHVDTFARSAGRGPLQISVCARGPLRRHIFGYLIT